MHEIELAVRNGDESWCQCTCGWVSSKTTEDEAGASWAGHVAAASLAETTNTASA